MPGELAGDSFDGDLCVGAVVISIVLQHEIAQIV